MRAFVACIRNFVIIPVGTNGLQWCPVKAFRIFSPTQAKNAHDKLNSKNSKCVLDRVRNGISESSSQLLSLEAGSNECTDVEQNVVGGTGENTSVVEPCIEDVSTFAPYFKPSFNFAAYVNNSPTLQELVKLGVNLHRLERKKGVPEFILQMEFNRNMKEHIR
jgi:hypothetical protein